MSVLSVLDTINVYLTHRTTQIPVAKQRVKQMHRPRKKPI